jgi:nitrilase
MIVVDVDLDDVVRGKLDFDPTGHYARPDVFDLRVNRRPQSPVTFLQSDGPSSLNNAEAKDRDSR